jgi:hypothetical protein
MIVCERLLEHPTDDEHFRLFASRVDLIHARVGTAQHAQITDPLESKKECEQIQKWWEMIWDAQKDREWILIEPEYGPAPYAMTSDINVWELTNQEMERQKKNYAKWSNNIISDVLAPDTSQSDNSNRYEIERSDANRKTDPKERAKTSVCTCL